MIIQIDTREQKPLTFTHEWVENTERVTLDVGDYRCKYKNGHESLVVYERKSLGDLFGTMGNGYARFKREIERASTDGVKLVIIVEGSVSDVLKGYEHSRLSGVSVLRKLFTLWFRYGVVFVCCRDRREMSEYILNSFVSYGRQFVQVD